MKIIHVVAGVIRDKDRFLCVQRNISDQIYRSLRWEFPGGKVEVGESNHLALSRELKEELSISVEVLDFILQVQHSYPSFRLVMDVYFCHPYTTKLRLTKDHIAYKWLAIDELLELDWMEADIPVVQHLVRMGL